MMCSSVEYRESKAGASRLLVLYSRLPQYMLACIEHFCSTQNAHALIVCYPPSQDAPYKHNTGQQIKILEIGSNDWESIARCCMTFDPDAVLVSGWTNSDYLALARKFLNKRKSVVCMTDNQWNGTLKQRMGVIASPFFIRNTFSHIWVPGQRQEEFARRLGFKQEQIKTGVYVANATQFTSKPTDNKRFLFVGRLIKEKNISHLAEVFRALNLSGWTLDIVGNGILENELYSDERVALHPFMQPDDLADFASQGGVFILPSVFEPWGVVVHEFATAGYPLILSLSVGASDAFLVEGENGFAFNVKDNYGLHDAMLKMSSTPPEVRIRYGVRSSELAETISHMTWTKTLESLIEK